MILGALKQEIRKLNQNQKKDQMKHKLDSLDKLLLAISFFSATCFLITVTQGCSYTNKKMGQNDDWIGEEIVEEVIKSQTGLRVDLTPESQER